MYTTDFISMYAATQSVEWAYFQVINDPLQNYVWTPTIYVHAHGEHMVSTCMKLRTPRHELVNCRDIFTIKPGLF